MSLYGNLLRIPGTRSLLALSLLTRSANIPIGALITVLAFEVSGSWTSAAVAGGIAAGASAPVMWITGRWMDIWSPRLVLLAFLPGGLVPALFLLQPSGIWLFLLALLIGLARPPSGTTIRVSWQKLVPEGSERLAAYGLDASLVPLAGAAGAAAGSLLLLAFGSVGVVVALCLASTLSTLLLALHKTSREPGASALDERDNLPPLGWGVWATVFVVALSWAALVGLEILVGDLFGPELLLVVTAIGGVSVSLGALFSHRAGDKSGRGPLGMGSMLAASSLVIITLCFLWEPWLALPAIVAFGLARGIISASGSTFLSVASPAQRRSEALAMYASGVLVGQALYRPIAGAMLLVSPLLILLFPAALFFALGRKLRRPTE